MRKPKSGDWTVTTNARRHRKMITLTLAPETAEALVTLSKRRNCSRGAVVDELVAAATLASARRG